MRAACSVRREERVDLRANERMQTSFERAALFGIGEDFRGDALSLRRIGKDFMDDIIRVDCLDAELVQELRDE